MAKTEYEEYMVDTLRDDPKFREAWRSWLLDRKDRGKKVTARAAQLQLQHLAIWQNPVAVINQSIECGWTGLFEIKNGSGIGTSGRELRRPSNEIADQIARLASN